jgi:pimeloyl-ACP methyl ester carboxylesterase
MTDWQRVERNRAPAIAYRVEGEGPAVLLIHGVGGDSSNWDAIAARLRERFRVVAMDLRGHGRSGRIQGPLDAIDFARDAVAVLDHAGIGACRVAGFSLGGAVALALALEFPSRVERFAVIGTVFGRNDDERIKAAERVAYVREYGVEGIAEANRSRWFTDEFQRTHPGVVQARVEQVKQCDPMSYLHAFTVFATTDFAGRADAITVPTLIVTGEHDLAATPTMARHLHRAIAGSEVHILPTLRHSLLIEAPDRITALLEDFL